MGKKWLFQSHKYYYRKLSRKIKNIKKVEEIEIVLEMIKNTNEIGRITDKEAYDLRSKLSERAKEIGEKKFVIKLGPFGQIGVEKKGAIL